MSVTAITKTKVCWNQSAADYHDAPGASASRLKKFKRSAAHMRYAMDNPQKPTQAMIIGSATHSAVLEPDLFRIEWGRLPEGDGRSKAVKEAKDDLIARFGADHILKPDIYDNILAMRESVFGHPLAVDLLDGAAVESSHYWTDDDSGVQCKARIDALPKEHSVWDRCVIDVKTTTDASAMEFQRTAFNFGYYLAAAHYLAATNALLPDNKRDRFIFIVIEKEPPFLVAIYELDDDALRMGSLNRKILLGQWATCESNHTRGRPNAWPGFPVEIQDLSLPDYAYTR
jgi:hypothetical protein